jgi:hypothetical protein
MASGSISMEYKNLDFTSADTYHGDATYNMECENLIIIGLDLSITGGRGFTGIDHSAPCSCSLSSSNFYNNKNAYSPVSAYYSNVTLVNCIFNGNRKDIGGEFQKNQPQFTVTRCWFTDARPPNSLMKASSGLRTGTTASHDCNLMMIFPECPTIVHEKSTGFCEKLNCLDVDSRGDERLS